MATLPTVENFGPRPAPRSQREVVSFEADQVAKAEAKAAGLVGEVEAKGFRQTAEAAGEVADIAFALKEKFEKETVRREALTLDVEYSNALRSLQLGDGSDLNPGYLNLRGEAALQGRQAHVAALKNLHTSMLNKASSDRVLALVHGSFNARLKSTLDMSGAHFGRQHRVANQAAFEGHQASIADDAAVLGAAGNTEGVVDLAELAGTQAARYAQETGADPQFEAEAAITRVLVSEIERQAVDDPTEARAFFEANKAAIDGRAYNRIEVFLKRADRETDELVRRVVVDAVAVLDRGRIPANLATVQGAAAGSRYAKTLAEAVEDSATVAGFLQQSLPEQAAALAARPETTTRRDLATEDRMRRTHTALVRAVDQGHGLAVAAEAGVIADLGPVDFKDPASLLQRSVQAVAAGRWIGQPVSPLTPAEADGLVAAIDEAPPGQVADLLRTLSTGFGHDQAIVLAGDLAPKRPELAVAITLARDQPLVAREIVLGGRVLRENPDVMPGKVDRIAAVESVVENMFTEAPEGATSLGSFTEAAAALYAKRRVPTGDLNFDGGMYKQALSDVMGGVIEFNGRTILPPIPGMSEDTFEDLVERLTDEDLTTFGNGAPVFSDGTALGVGLFDRLGKDAQFITSGFGTYIVFMPGLGKALADGGGAYEIDLRRFAE